MVFKRHKQAATLTQRWYREGYYGHQTLGQMVALSAKLFPASYLAIESDVRPGRVDLECSVDNSRRLARALFELGVQQGDVVAVQLPNWIEAAELSAAVWLLGAILLPVPVNLEHSDLVYVLQDSGARVLINPGVWRGRDYNLGIEELRCAAESLQIVTLASSAPQGVIAWPIFRETLSWDVPKPTAHADDIAMIIYTSGTTSKPKGVLHTHNTLLSEVRFGSVFYGSNSSGACLSPWPFGHIASILPFLRWWLLGVNTVLADRWDPDFVVELIDRHGIEVTSGVPYFLSSLLAAARRTGATLSTLKNYGTGAANVSTSLVEECEAEGIYAYRIYGSTELPTLTAGLQTDPVALRLGTDGRCLPGCELRIVNDEGHDLPCGQDGELAIMGPEMFVGYTSASANDQAFLSGGWFLTGDIGHLDADGYLTITDRKKDIIIRGGENISSREVEEVLMRHPSVAECAVIACPDKRLGEIVCAVIVLSQNSELNSDLVRAYFQAGSVARHKAPERLIFVSELPRTATGKVQKHILRNLL